MKTIIAGMRDFTDASEVYRAIKLANITITEVVSGGATGVDAIGEQWAEENGLTVDRYPVTKDDWNKFGRSAGPRRNAEMATVAEALIAVWDCKSKGTKNMIETALNQKLKVYVYPLYPEDVPMWLFRSDAVVLIGV